MASQTLQVEVCKEAYEVSQHLVKLISVVKQAVSDGVQLSDLGLISSALLADLLPAMSQLESVKKAAALDLAGVEKAIALSAIDLQKALS